MTYNSLLLFWSETPGLSSYINSSSPQVTYWPLQRSAVLEELSKYYPCDISTVTCHMDGAPFYTSGSMGLRSYRCYYSSCSSPVSWHFSFFCTLINVACWYIASWNHIPALIWFNALCYRNNSCFGKCHFQVDVSFQQGSLLSVGYFSLCCGKGSTGIES